MKKTIILFIVLGFSISQLYAQNVRFIHSGIINFEKSINQHAQIKKMMSTGDARVAFSFEDYKKNVPQFKLLKSTLTFSDSKTFFLPDAEAETGMNMISMGTDQPNTTYTDLSNRTFVTQKSFLDEVMLVKDSLRKINWKVTTEMRTIAGYECRRANALIMDSVYVVAFYTDKIPVSGGPESFTGLPGMILGVALPHENITWFAKTVTDKAIPPTEIKPPVKGKPTDNKGLFNTITKSLGHWGANANGLIKSLLL